MLNVSVFSCLQNPLLVASLRMLRLSVFSVLPAVCIFCGPAFAVDSVPLPAAQVATVPGESPLSDDEFLKKYAHLCHSQVEKFIAETLLTDSYIERYGRSQADADAAAYRKAVYALTASADSFYRAHFHYVQTCIVSADHLFEQELLNEYREMLRRCLLRDLSNLSRGMALWLTETYDAESDAASESEDDDCIHNEKTPLESSLTRYMRDTAATEYYEGMIVSLRTEKLKTMRNVILSVMEECGEQREFLTGYEGCGGTRPEHIELFNRAEKAWDTYCQALVDAHSPVFNQELTGTGTGSLMLQVQQVLLSSHMELLLEMMNLQDKRYEM